MDLDDDEEDDDGEDMEALEKSLGIWTRKRPVVEKELAENEEYKKLRAEYIHRKGKKPAEYYVRLEEIKRKLAESKQESSKAGLMKDQMLPPPPDSEHAHMGFENLEAISKVSTPTKQSMV
jgi:hypothetical protein